MDFLSSRFANGRYANFGFREYNVIQRIDAGIDNDITTSDDQSASRGRYAVIHQRNRKRDANGSVVESSSCGFHNVCSDQAGTNINIPTGNDLGVCANSAPDFRYALSDSHGNVRLRVALCCTQGTGRRT